MSMYSRTNLTYMWTSEFNAGCLPPPSSTLFFKSGSLLPGAHSAGMAGMINHIPLFFVGTGNPNSTSPACKTSALLTRLGHLTAADIALIEGISICLFHVQKWQEDPTQEK